MARLSSYKAKRKFDQTFEPKPKIKKSKARKLKFCVQRHAARRLHYDLRLELDGVLVSFAVPKGPTMDSSEKRLAIKVEDHPLDYLTFEGVIPKGNYGAGTVELWDIGTYAADVAEMREGLRTGHLHFVLFGRKLEGAFVLVKLKGDQEWLLRKVDDDHLAPKKFKATAMPKNIKPMLASTAEKPFDSPEWLFEIKWDGYRALAFLQKAHVDLVSRRGKILNNDYPSLIEELATTSKKAIIDGEIVVLDEKGLPHFELLQDCATNPACIPHYMAFDLLYVDGQDLRDLPLITRKRMLKDLVESIDLEHVHYTDHVDGKGIALFREAKKIGLEGLIAKRKSSTYSSTRSREWQKIKSSNRDEFVIIGFTKPRGSRTGYGALLLAEFKNGDLKFVGHVGTGFDAPLIAHVMSKMKPLIINKSPLKAVVKTNMVPTWVTPKLIAEVSFHERTSAGLLRQPVFHGIRDDKSVSDMKQEKLEEKPAVFSFISNSDKLFWPDDGFTKGDMLSYYEAIAPIMIPHVKDRPLTLRRYPDGILGADFYQKHIDKAPSWLKTVLIEHSRSKKREGHQACANDVASLLYIANLGSIEIHPMLARAHNLAHPDFLVIDLDPEALSIRHVVEVALYVHELLDDVKLPNYCKTSGGRGLHIYVPLGSTTLFKDSLHLAELIALIIRDRFPKLVSLERSPKRRQERVYVDYLQNAKGKSTVAPYSLRALPHAPVSTPLRWKEVTKNLDPLEFTIISVPKRVKKMGDIFAPILNETIDLVATLKNFEKFL